MNLHYQTIGQGPSLIILHGLFGSSDNWVTIAKMLAASFKVYLVDLRNHGASFHDSDFDYTVMARDVTNLVQDLGLKHYSILGHSLGGKVAMFHALKNQQDIENLIVVDIAPKYYGVHHQQIIDGLLSINPAEISSRSEADELLKKSISEYGIRQFLLKNLKRNASGSFHWKFNLMVIAKEIQQVGEALPKDQIIAVRTLFIRGGSSQYISKDDYLSIQEQFPESRIETIDGAGHWVHAEAPKEFLASVTSFLNG